MSEHKIKLWEEIDVNTQIGWWNANREKLNEVIRMVNEWQINHRQDTYYGELVLAKIESVNRWNIDNDRELSEWQTDLLSEIKIHVNGVLNGKKNLL